MLAWGGLACGGAPGEPGGAADVGASETSVGAAPTTDTSAGTSSTGAGESSAATTTTGAASTDATDEGGSASESGGAPTTTPESPRSLQAPGNGCKVAGMLSPLSAFSAVAKIRTPGTTALSHSTKEDLLRRFEVETSEHSILQLDMLLAAIVQDARESGDNVAWLAAIEDPSLSSAARFEALSGLREQFLRVLRASRDPLLGNRMVATVAAGLSRLTYPEDVVARSLIVAQRLIPEDIDLLHRFVFEGIERAEKTAKGEFMYWPRKMVQENFTVRFALDDGKLSHALDPAAYNALKDTHLIIDGLWLGDPDAPRGKPAGIESMFPHTHEPFKLEWRLSAIGTAIIEAFIGQPLVALLEHEAP